MIINKLLIIIFFSSIIFFLLVKKKKITESFLTKDDIPENVKKQIGTTYNAIVLPNNQNNLPFVSPIDKIKVDPYDNLSVCTINRNYVAYKDYTPNEKESINSSVNVSDNIRNKKNENNYKKKKYYDNYYGISLAPKFTDYQEEVVPEEGITIGNICKLSPWSLWSKCNSEDCKDYGKKTRTRKVLKSPKGCYSPLNPILKQTIPCNSSLCFCDMKC